jgi:hypothetical protein
MSEAPDTGDRLPDKELAELVRRLDREIQAVLAKHGRGPEQGEQLVFETMLALGRRWTDLDDRGGWFMRRLEEACQRAVEGPAGEAS